MPRAVFAGFGIALRRFYAGSTAVGTRLRPPRPPARPVGIAPAGGATCVPRGTARERRAIVAPEVRCVLREWLLNPA